MFVTILALLQVAVAPAPPVRTLPCRLRGPTGKLIDVNPKLCEQSTQNDLARRMQAQTRTTDVEFDIDETGHIEQCHVVKTSGAPELDAKACAIMIEKGRYASTDRSKTLERQMRRLTIRWSTAS